LFLREAIDKKVHYDTIFIYSDMQAGTGNLYGTNINSDDTHENGGSYVDVLKMVEEYREKVNSKVNIFTTQVAGYNNNLIPCNLYRGGILTGWTGKESVFASELIKVWDGIETKSTQIVELEKEFL
jgi:hypothetical protein